MIKGYVTLVLHAHLPYIRHPKTPASSEERWLFEAISETYMPFIDIFQRLHDDGVNFNLTCAATHGFLPLMVPAPESIRAQVGIGYDLDYNYIKPFISPDGTRIQTGIKYYKVTGTENKDIYDPLLAENIAQNHAEDFIKSRIDEINFLSNKMDKPPIIVCPYDAELFGHWWYDGPKWLEAFLRKSFTSQSDFELIHLNEYLYRHPVLQICSPQPNSWGRDNYNNFWLNEKTDWMYRQLHTASSYAAKRFNDHIYRFNKICDDIISNNIDEKWLNYINSLDNIFPFIDYKIYANS